MASADLQLEMEFRFGGSVMAFVRFGAQTGTTCKVQAKAPLDPYVISIGLRHFHSNTRKCLQFWRLWGHVHDVTVHGPSELPLASYGAFDLCVFVT